MTPDAAVELRRIGPDDWRLWREVRLRALAESPQAFSSSLEEWTGKGDTESRWRARLDSVPLNVVAVGVGDHRLVGQVSGTALDDVGQVELISLWAAPEVRGTGVGAALVARVIEWAGEEGADAVILGVKRSNRWAIAAYDCAGFRAAGPGGEPDEMLMRRPLGPPPRTENRPSHF